VTFLLNEYSPEPDIKLRIKKKEGPLKSKSSKKPKSSKDYLTNFKPKKSKSKDDIPNDNINKKPKGLQRRRSKSNDTENIRMKNHHEKRLKKERRFFKR